MIPGVGNDNRRSVPWDADEFIKIDGVPRVYSWTETGALVVHFVGRAAIPVTDLRQSGHRIEWPQRLRRVDYR